MTSPTWEQIKKRIGERTGLKTDAEIEAYSFFCDNTARSDRVIMYGGVQHEFYHQLVQQASPAMQELEKIFNDAVGNHVHEDLSGKRHPLIREQECWKGVWTQLPKPESPISYQAKKVFADFYHQFVEKGLVSAPKGMDKRKKAADSYPRLRGYNYFNDLDFYRRTGKNGRTLVA